MKPIEAVEHLLAPVPPDDFLSDRFEKRPLHVQRFHRTHYDRWMTVDSFLKILTTVDPDSLRLKSVKNDLCYSSITLRQAMDAFSEGSTIVANQLHLYDPAITELCRQLEMFFYHPFQANVYFTPAGSQGFAAHFDVHDVYVLQILGGKRWKVYEPEVELPLNEQARTVNADVARVPSIDVVMKPGDLLYLPRGYIHAAKAANYGASLHLSLGMLGCTWRDALVMAVQDAAARDVRLRKTLRMGPHAAPSVDGGARLEEVLSLVLEQMRSRMLKDAEERFVVARPAVLPEFHLTGVHPSLTADSRVERDPLVVYALQRQPDQIEIKFQGKCVEFPLEVATELNFMLTRDEPYTLRDVPGELDEPTRLRLLEHLHRVGLLRTAGPDQVPQS